MYEREVKEVEMNYKKWLDFSNLDVKDLLKYRVGEFKINSKVENGFGVIELGYIDKENFIKIGESILYEINNKEMKYDVALLILYIAERLDDMNKKAPAFLNRGERYFYKKAKSIIDKIPLI